jgi:hypothetical protein
MMGIAVIASTMMMCNEKLALPEKWPVSVMMSAPTCTTYSGGAIQFSSVVAYNDGSANDATGITKWTLSPGRLGVIDGQGYFMANLDGTGTEIVYAEYQGHRDSLIIESIRVTKINLMQWRILSTTCHPALSV